MKLKIADQFLKRFKYDLTTIQVFPPVIDGKTIWPTKGGRYLATGEPGSTALAYKGSLLKQPFLKDLLLLQRQRMGVYFMVNEGDGELHNHKIVRNQQAVHTLKALFVDTDEGSPKTLKQFCNKFKLKPHSIVESSPGKYHYYFLLKESDATKDNVYLWQSTQHRLASIDPNFDDSMADLGRVLRIPGFYHTKSKPFLIQEVYKSEHSLYELQEIFERLGANKTPPRKGSKFTRPVKKLSLGARHDALNAYLGSMSNSIRDFDGLLDSAIGFSQRHFKDSHEWLPGGNRYGELSDQIDYVISEREKEDLQESLTLLDTKQTEQGFTKLPDEFYLNAPGIVGKIVREIIQYSAQPYPSFAFAAACSLIGTLKASFIRGEYLETPPSAYFLCLTGPGRGKDFPRSVAEKVFTRLGLDKLVVSKFRSVQGFLKQLGESGGVCLALHDEAHHLFAQLRSSDNDYITQFKPHLLSIFSSANTTLYNPGKVMTHSMTIPPIPYPTLNYCGFGIPEGFESTFQAAELGEGLLPRFLVLQDHRLVKKVDRNAAKQPKRYKFERDLREMGTKLRTSLETVLLKDENNPSGPTELRKFMELKFADDAYQVFEDYSEKIANSRNNTTKVLDCLQSRLVEQVSRISVIMADTVVTKEMVKFAITFVTHCYENLTRHVGSFDKGQGNRDLDDLLAFIEKRMRINNGPMQSQELRDFRIRDYHSLTNTLKLAIDLQKVQKIENFRKDGKTKGRTSTAYVLL